MAERLGVNIFSGVLPSSYLFVDDCSDSSKWRKPPAPPVSIGYSTITTGDAYGYIDKGLRFTTAGGAGFLVEGHAYRSFIAPPTRTVIVGWVFRPCVEFYELTDYPAPLTPGRYINFQVFVPVPSSVNPVGQDTNWFQVQAQCKTDAGGMGYALTRFLAGNVGAMTTLGELAGNNINPNSYPDLPWYRVICIIEGNVLKNVTVNNIVYTPNVTMTPDVANYNGQFHIASFRDDPDVGQALSLDLDQLWASDSEYRI